eukprot:COSAG06_NODE_55796_length_288_cov_0.507937_1_plen_69_part_10
MYKCTHCRVVASSSGECANRRPAPTWATAPVTSVVAAGTGFTLNWVAGDAYGTGTDECATNRGTAHTMT